MVDDAYPRCFETFVQPFSPKLRCLPRAEPALLGGNEKNPPLLELTGLCNHGNDGDVLSR